MWRAPSILPKDVRPPCPHASATPELGIKGLINPFLTSGIAAYVYSTYTRYQNLVASVGPVIEYYLVLYIFLRWPWLLSLFCIKSLTQAIFLTFFPTIHFTERPEKRRTSDLKCQMFPNLRQKLAKRRGTRKIPFSWLGRYKLSRYCHGVDAQPGILDGQQNIFNSTWGHDRCVTVSGP